MAPRRNISGAERRQGKVWDRIVLDLPAEGNPNPIFRRDLTHPLAQRWREVNRYVFRDLQPSTRLDHMEWQYVAAIFEDVERYPGREEAMTTARTQFDRDQAAQRAIEAQPVLATPARQDEAASVQPEVTARPVRRPAQVRQVMGGLGEEPSQQRQGPSRSEPSIDAGRAWTREEDLTLLYLRGELHLQMSDVAGWFRAITSDMRRTPDGLTARATALATRPQAERYTDAEVQEHGRSMTIVCASGDQLDLPQSTAAPLVMRSRRPLGRPKVMAESTVYLPRIPYGVVIFRRQSRQSSTYEEGLQYCEDLYRLFTTDFQERSLPNITDQEMIPASDGLAMGVIYSVSLNRRATMGIFGHELEDARIVQHLDRLNSRAITADRLAKITLLQMGLCGSSIDATSFKTLEKWQSIQFSLWIFLAPKTIRYLIERGWLAQYRPSTQDPGYAWIQCDPIRLGEVAIAKRHVWADGHGSYADCQLDDVEEQIAYFMRAAWFQRDNRGSDRQDLSRAQRRFYDDGARVSEGYTRTLPDI